MVIDTNQPGLAFGERHAIYFLPQPAGSKTVTAETTTFAKDTAEEDDTFFEITADDLRARQQELTSRVQIETNRPLLTKAYLARKNYELKHRAYPHTTLRFTIQNLVFVQARFLSSEPVSTLFDFVRHFLRVTSNFELRLGRERLAPDDSRSLLEADLAPASRLILGVQASTPMEVFDSNALDHATEADADIDRKDWLSVNSEFRSFERILCENNIKLRDCKSKRAATLILGNGSANTISSDQRDGSSARISKSTIPKWLKKN